MDAKNANITNITVSFDFLDWLKQINRRQWENLDIFISHLHELPPTIVCEDSMAQSPQHFLLKLEFVYHSMLGFGRFYGT